MAHDDSLKCTYLEERSEGCFFSKSSFTDGMLPWKKMVGTNPLTNAKKTSKYQVNAFQLPENVSVDWRKRP